MQESVRAPHSPQNVHTQDSQNENAQFQALKRSLNEITSWELAGASWDEGLIMKFSENFSDERAKLFLRVIG